MKSIAHYVNALNIRGKHYIYKKKGWKTKRRIIVIESDDWGSIRMPSISVMTKLLDQNIKLNPEKGLDKYDTLASNDDLELLIDLLYSFKDKNNNPAKITLNTIMTNPFFSKIKASGYEDYYYELFTDTLKRYPNHDRSFDLWKMGIKNGVFKPQFHGREHLNVQMWLDALRKDYPGVRIAFENEVFSNHIDISFDIRERFLEAFNIVDASEYSFIQNSITEGLELFERVFGFRSKSMIAPNYLWDDEIEKCAYMNKVKYIQGATKQRYSIYISKLKQKNNNFHFLGEKNVLGQIYLTRNCMFEPSHNYKYGFNKCVSDIETAFKFNKPAIICSHRLNYIGGLVKKNRDNTLKELSNLLSTIIKKYPDVEFMFSDELGDNIVNSKGIYCL